MDRVEHVVHPVDDHLRGQGFGDPRQVVGVAGDHANIAVVALVTRARHGEFHQRHTGIGTALRLGRLDGHSRREQRRGGGQLDGMTLALVLDGDATP